MENKTWNLLILGTVGLILITAVSVRARQAHTETQPTAVTSELKQLGVGETEYSKYGRNLAINLYLNLQLTGRGRDIVINENKKTNKVQYDYYDEDEKGIKKYKANAYNIKTDEKVCKGEVLHINDFSVSGEYFQKGGPTDSPPVTYVDNLDEIKNQIENKGYSTDTRRMVICGWAEEDERETGPQRCVVDGAVLCSQTCQVEAENQLEKLSEKEFKVTGAGKATLEVSCGPDCILFVDRKEGKYTYEDHEWGLPDTVSLDAAYGYMELREYAGRGGKTKDLSMKKVYNLKSGEGLGPEMEVTKVYVPRDVEKGSSFIVRLEVENKGDMKGNMDEIDLNLPQSEVIYGPESIDPDKKEEILIRTRTSDVRQLGLNMEYTSEHLTCLNKKSFQQKFNLGTITVSSAESCSSNSDCPSGEICCAGTCRDPTTGVCDDIDGDGVMDTWVEM